MRLTPLVAGAVHVVSRAHIAAKLPGSAGKARRRSPSSGRKHRRAPRQSTRKGAEDKGAPNAFPVILDVAGPRIEKQGAQDVAPFRAAGAL